MSKSPELVIIGLDGAVPSHIKNMVRSGRLPAISRLVNGGVWFADCRPAFPSITPTCWASLSTGAMPATHGAIDQDIHPPGTALDWVVSAYHGDNIHAERLWEAAARAGKKSLVMQMPTTGPSRTDLVRQVAGAGCAAIAGASPSIPTVPPAFEVKKQLFDTKKDKDIRWDGGTPGSGQWQPVEDGKTTPKWSGEGCRAVMEVDTRGSVSGVESFAWYAEVGEGWIRLSSSADGDSESHRIEVGHWSPPSELSLETSYGTVVFRYRAKLLRASGSNRDLALYVSAMGDVGRVTSPDWFGDLVAEARGVPASNGHSVLLQEYDDTLSFLEAEALNFEWQYEVMREACRREAIDIAVVYSVYLDSMNHKYRNVVEDLVDVPQSYREKVLTAYDRGYELADEFVGRLIDLFGPDTTFVLVSDHGSVGYETVISPFDVLEQAGLLVYHASNSPAHRKVDWSRTKAFPVGCCHVYVNKEGRDPQGIVAAGDCDRTVQLTIRALQRGFWNESRQQSALAFALPNDQAGFVGLGGPLCGDVVYGIAGGRIGGYIGGVHACQIPTAKTATGDIRSTLLINGPGFKKGIEAAVPVHLWDIAPTLCHALGYPGLNDADGKIIAQALA